MESQSARFFDYMDLNDPCSYQSPNSDENGDAICLEPFNSYVAKDPVADFLPMADAYGSFPNGEVDPMSTQIQEELFVDPELYSPESNDDAKPQIRVGLASTSRLSTRKTSSTKSPSHRTSQSGSTSTDITQPEREPPRKRRAKKTSRRSNAADDQQKRNKFLERNRIAASKCREKKKRYVSGLEESKMDIELQNIRLHHEHDALSSEVSALKHHLMCHAKCNDLNIDRWLSREASKFVQTKPELFGQQLVPLGQFPAAELPTGSPRSRNASNASSYTALQGIQYDGLPSSGQFPAAELPTGSPRSRNVSNASSYPALQGMQYDGLPCSGERHGSIAFSHGSGALYPSPTKETFATLPALKREPDLSYNPMADPMFSPDQSTFPGDESTFPGDQSTFPGDQSAFPGGT